MRHEVVLYTRHGCHLCDEAEAILVRYGLRPRLVDIDADPALREQFTDCVPVVVVDGKERFRGRVNEVLLRRLLAGTGDHTGDGPGERTTEHNGEREA